MSITETPPNLPLTAANYRTEMYKGIAAVGLAAASLCAPWESVKIIGMAVLAGMSCEAVNNRIGFRDCAEFYTFLNQPLDTVNPNLNAFAYATSYVGIHVFYGALQAIFARASFRRSKFKITAVQLAPYLIMGSAVALLVSHVRSRMAQKAMATKPYEKFSDISLNFQAKWEACFIRGMTFAGFTGVTAALLSCYMFYARIGLLERMKYKKLSVSVCMAITAGLVSSFYVPDLLFRRFKDTY